MALQQLAISKTKALANGVDYITVSNIPQNSSLSVYFVSDTGEIPIETIFPFTDTSLDITFDTPGLYKVTVKKPHHPDGPYHYNINFEVMMFAE